MNMKVRTKRGFSLLLALCLVLSMLPAMSLPVRAAVSDVYIPLDIASGFNADIVVEKEAALQDGALTHAATFFDGDNASANYAFYETGYSSGQYGLPVGGALSFTDSGQLYQYQLAPYTEANAVQVSMPSDDASADSGSFHFTTPGAFAKISILGAAGNGYVTFNATVTYTDGTTTTATFEAPNWWRNNYCDLDRVKIANVGAGSISNNSVIALYHFEIDTDNTKLIKQLDFTYNSQRLENGAESGTIARANLLAVSGCVPSSAPAAPSATSATLASSSGFTANWETVSDALSYTLDVSTSADFSTMVTGYNNLSVTANSQIVTGLSANTTYYYRVRAVNAAAQSASSNTIQVTTAAASDKCTVTGKVTDFNTGAGIGGVTLYTRNGNTVLGETTTGQDGTFSLEISKIVADITYTTCYINCASADGSYQSYNLLNFDIARDSVSQDVALYPLAPSDATLDFSNLNESKTFAGSRSGIAAWDNDTKTLTLTNFDHTSTAPIALKLPAGTTVVASPYNAINKPTGSPPTQNGTVDTDSCGLYCEGSVEFQGGSLSVNALNSTNGKSVGFYMAPSSDSTPNSLSVSDDGLFSAIGWSGSERSVGILAEGNLLVDGFVEAYSQAAGTAPSGGIDVSGSISIDGAYSQVSGFTAASDNSFGIKVTEGVSSTVHGKQVAAADGYTFGGNTPNALEYNESSKSFHASGVSDPSKSVVLILEDASGDGGDTDGGSTSQKAPGGDSLVIVDGKRVNAGTVTVDKTSGETKTVVNQDMIETLIGAAKSNVTVIVPISKESTTATAELVVKNIDDMAKNNMTLSVQVNNVLYSLPASAIDTAGIMAKLGTDNPAEAPISLSITMTVDAATQALADKAIASHGGEVVFPPMQFSISACYADKTVDITEFAAYVSRTVEVTAEQAARITTAVVVDADGTVRQIPTNVYKKDGKHYAEINSLTNSTYVLIFNEVSFADASGKWYEAHVNEMGSRKIIAGFGENQFAGERSITRAEFAAIVVRALGLPAKSGNAFRDVPSSAWYADAVNTAYSYGLISGIDGERFAPTRCITRQEAMLILQRAASVTAYAGHTGNLESFKDAASVAGWAENAAKFCVGSGLFSGYDGNLNPTQNISRAEAASIVLRLMQESGLIDKRS